MMPTMTPTRFAAALLLYGMLTAPWADAEAQALKKISDGQVSRTAPLTSAASRFGVAPA